jgi:hypothetical protein
VLDLYEGRWEEEALGEGEYVISADEKTSIQARDRRHGSLPAGERGPMRVEHEEYERKGALAYPWPPGMYTGRSSSVVASRRTASSPSAALSMRSSKRSLTPPPSECSG